MNYEELLYYFFEGNCCSAYDFFGANLEEKGVTFRVYAPKAKTIQISGSFNDWQKEEMIKDERGIFSLYVHYAKEFDIYQYHIEGTDGKWCDKADPYAFFSEYRPKNASVVFDINKYAWQDHDWLSKRNKGFDEALNIYEIHLGSWKKHQDGSWYNYDELGAELIPYIKEQGYTHIEILPLCEHPLDASWGYQVSGYFSATSRYGTPDQLMSFVAECHKNEIGVIMDFVPVHFVKDDFGLTRFDGSPLYEYSQPKKANSEWGSLNFDLAKEEVRSFLISSIDYWISKYHFDGIRFDAISNLIYWGGKKAKGHNEEALVFIKRLNGLISQRHPDVILIAEDSSDFLGVTTNIQDGGLGFDYKWNMGWMNDTLKYYEMDFNKRSKQHNLLSFSMAYFYSERYLLPFSHDEVVHGKKAIIDKMYGSYDQKIAQVKNLYIYQYTHPGKKLNFMGNEWGHFREWDENKEMDWFLLENPIHRQLQLFIRDLNHIYLDNNEFYQKDYNSEGFSWLDVDNDRQSIYSYYRKSDDKVAVIVLNMNDVFYQDYEIGVPENGEYQELINSDDRRYNGNGQVNQGVLKSYSRLIHNQNQAIKIDIAPLSAIVLKLL